MKITRSLLRVIQSLGVSKPEFMIRYQEVRSWINRSYSSPSPNFIKRKVLIRNGINCCTWIETGTYLGGTTKILSKHGRSVISIEPDAALFSRAQKKLKHLKNVRILNGLSEDLLPETLSHLYGDICFWLDGHFSSGLTFKGPNPTPILDELATIKINLVHFNNVVILIDDVRLFQSPNSDSGYPSLDVLTNWASSNDLSWRIEHDIFIMSNC
jgi:hypothetical protein